MSLFYIGSVFCMLLHFYFLNLGKKYKKNSVKPNECLYKVFENSNLKVNSLSELMDAINKLKFGNIPHVSIYQDKLILCFKYSKVNSDYFEFCDINYPLSNYKFFAQFCKQIYSVYEFIEAVKK